MRRSCGVKGAQHHRVMGAGDRREIAGAPGFCLAGKPSEGGGLDQLRIEAQAGGGLDGDREARCERRHEHRVRGAAAAQVDLFRGQRGQCLGDRVGGEGDECRLHIGGVQILAEPPQALIEPFRGEVLAPGALGRWGREIRIILQKPQ